MTRIFFLTVLFLLGITLSPLYASKLCMGIPTNERMCVKVDDKNVLGEDLSLCCTEPLTGFYRNGFCQTGEMDRGVHTVCAKVTDAFLKFSKSKGNDLTTPLPEYSFPGLKDGDKWCLCAARWLEAEQAGYAPPLYLDATHEKTLQIIELETLKKYAVDLN